MLNKAILIGHLGRDPETRFTKNGNAVCHFSVATNYKYKDDNKTEWHNIVAWGKIAELCGEYLKKGSKIYIEGRIQTNEWEDKEGNKKQNKEIIAETIKFLDGVAKNESMPQNDQPTNDLSKESSYDDIPF